MERTLSACLEINKQTYINEIANRNGQRKQKKKWFKQSNENDKAQWNINENKKCENPTTYHFNCGFSRMRAHQIYYLYAIENGF